MWTFLQMICMSKVEIKEEINKQTKTERENSRIINLRTANYKRYSLFNNLNQINFIFHSNLQFFKAPNLKILNQPVYSLVKRIVYIIHLMLFYLRV